MASPIVLTIERAEIMTQNIATADNSGNNDVHSLPGLFCIIIVVRRSVVRRDVRRK